MTHSATSAMYSEYEIRQIHLSIASQRQKVEQFLAKNGLRLDTVDYYAGVFRLDDDEMLAGGGLNGSVIKCIAVDPSLRDEGMSNRLVSHLISQANLNGYLNVQLFTKPENQTIFESLSFRLLAKAPKAILLETGNGGLDSYTDYLRKQSDAFEEYGKTLTHPYTGVVVMNANPFTRGHYYLLRQAAMQVDTLYVIVVREERSLFSYSDRKAMIEAGCSDLQNVVVLEGSNYAISEATFPTYFLKQLSDASDTQMTLDLDIFSRHIAPALHATMRFVGSEPNDPLTARYNELMHILLEPSLAVIEIPRMQMTGHAVNATQLRSAITNSSTEGLLHYLPWVPPTTVPYIIAQMATQALLAELNCTPKPGLVDRHDNGAHSDMDYALMQRSIETLHPYFVKLAKAGYQSQKPSVKDIRAIGMEGEKAMLTATGGVNTHKGALFSMGLAVVATSNALSHSYNATTDTFEFDSISLFNDIRSTIAQLTAQWPTPKGTHGSKVLSHNHKAKGALAMATEGYPLLFDSWLPFIAHQNGNEYALQQTLMLIMSQIDDTNILYRTNASTAQKVKKQATQMLSKISTEALETMNTQFIQQNISPGGAADMLSLTLFFQALAGEKHINAKSEHSTKQ